MVKTDLDLIFIQYIVANGLLLGLAIFIWSVFYV